MPRLSAVQEKEPSSEVAEASLTGGTTKSSTLPLTSGSARTTSMRAWLRPRPSNGGGFQPSSAQHDLAHTDNVERATGARQAKGQITSSNSSRARCTSNPPQRDSRRSARWPITVRSRPPIVFPFLACYTPTSPFPTRIVPAHPPLTLALAPLLAPPRNFALGSFRNSSPGLFPDPFPYPNQPLTRPLP